MYDTKQKIPQSCDLQDIRFLFSVELAGVEPASKRGSNMLSTCLSPDLIFEQKLDQGHRLLP